MPSVRTIAPALVGLLLLSLALPAHAGTAKAPEITDPSDDESVGGTVPIVAQPPAGTTVGLNVDLQAGWVTESADQLTFTIQVQGSGSASTSSQTAYDFHFEVAGKAYDAKATMDLSSTTPAGTGTITPGGAATAATAAGDHLIVLTVPKSGIGSPDVGAVLSNLFITAEGKTGGAQTTITDRAPDTGAGTNYVLVGSGPTQVVRGTLTNSTVSIAQGFKSATRAAYLYNWTQGPASVTIQLAVHGTGNASVEVRDASNAPVFQMDRSEVATTLNLTGLKAGKWTIALNYTPFKGNLTLAIGPWTPPVAPPPSTSTSASGTTTTTAATTHTTGTSSTTTKGTPGLGGALAATTLAVAALAVRRRLLE